VKAQQVNRADDRVNVRLYTDGVDDAPARLGDASGNIGDAAVRLHDARCRLEDEMASLGFGAVPDSFSPE
jgi:hypothetical protein